MFDIKGTVALVTGGASGIGLCYVLELLKNGAKGVTIADVSEKNGKSALEQIKREFGPNKAIFVKTDISQKDQFEEAFKECVDTYKHLDIVINNAGILNDAIWQTEVKINICGTINGTLLALEKYLPKYKSVKEAVLVNVSSIAGLDPFGGAPVYTGTKHAVLGFSRAFAHPDHYQRSQSKVLILCPGVTDTPLIDMSKDKSITDDYHVLVNQQINMVPSQTPQYVAQALMDLIREAENGSVWVVEGKGQPYEIDIPLRMERRKKE